MKISWRYGGLLLEPESSKESSALMRLMETFVLLGITEQHREPGPAPTPSDETKKE